MPPSKKPKSTSGNVRSLERGLRILQEFNVATPLLTNQELSRRTKLPKPTVTRLTQTLSALGYLERAPDRVGFYLAPRLAVLGAAAINGAGIARVCRPLMQRLADDVGAEVGLVAPDGMNIVYLENCRTEQEIQLHIVLGTRLPLEIIAVGHAYVASLEESERAALFQTIKLRHGPSWKELQTNLQNSIEQVHHRGFCVAEGWATNLRSAAAPLKIPGASMTYALDCSGPARSFPARRMNTEVGPKLLRLVKDIQQLYGRV